MHDTANFLYEIFDLFYYNQLNLKLLITSFNSFSLICNTNKEVFIYMKYYIAIWVPALPVIKWVPWGARGGVWHWAQLEIFLEFILGPRPQLAPPKIVLVDKVIRTNRLNWSWILPTRSLNRVNKGPSESKTIESMFFHIRTALAVTSRFFHSSSYHLLPLQSIFFLSLYICRLTNSERQAVACCKVLGKRCKLL